MTDAGMCFSLKSINSFQIGTSEHVNRKSVGYMFTSFTTLKKTFKMKSVVYVDVVKIF
jgi:hypothetical protein